ncbi:DUF4124 domain-containing protein [Pseudoalteromonas sp. ZZD1]|uniref:DUF4124 domain-containing protein n=1 Tax=Pseudoalteromonas sp. ZZD1 TaxID=3139395 RepID=UPI003BABEFF1
MKYFAYLAVMVLLISVVALFYLKRPDGQAWLTTEQVTSKSDALKEQMVALSSDTLDQAVKLVTDTSSKVVEKVTSGAKPSTTVIYKWQDDTGQWHYSDQPNPKGNSEQVVLDPNDVTVVAAEDTSILKGSAKSGGIPLKKSPTSAYDPIVIQKLFDDAEQVKSQLEQRNNTLEQSH